MQQSSKVCWGKKMGNLSTWYEVTVVFDSEKEAEKHAKEISKLKSCSIVQGSHANGRGSSREKIAEYKDGRKVKCQF